MNTGDSLVSLIVPVYNVGNYLNVCVDSLLRQTYANIQVILVDDGSTDGSADLCDAWADKDSRVMVIHQANNGVSMARNAGINAAEGDWLESLWDLKHIRVTMIRRNCVGFRFYLPC